MQSILLPNNLHKKAPITIKPIDRQIYSRILIIIAALSLLLLLTSPLNALTPYLHHNDSIHSAPHYTPVVTHYPYPIYTPHTHYPLTYRQKTSRYYLPWNRPEIIVDVDMRGEGMLEYDLILPVTFHGPEPKPPVLEQSIRFDTRQDFLINTVQHDSRIERELAAAELVEYPNLKSVAVLIHVLFNDPSGQLKIDAVETLAQIAHPTAIEPLLRCAALTHDPQLRQAAQQAVEMIRRNVNLTQIDLNNLTEQRFGTQRLAIFLDDLRLGDTDLRYDAARELAQYRETRSLTALINTLINDPDEKVRRAAAQSLGAIGDKMALPFLDASRQYDLKPTVRKTAVRAIETINKTG